MPEERDDDVEIDDSAEEEQNENEVALSIDSIDSQIPYLDKEVLNTVELRGLYRVKYKRIEKVDEEGNEIEDEEGEQQYALMPTQISVEDIFDKKTGKLIGDDNGVIFNVLFCDGNGGLYYGSVAVVSYKDTRDNVRYLIVPHGEGRMYKDKKCVYAGYFDNGKKCIGVSYKKNGVKFLHDYKGDQPLMKHTENDLLVSFENEGKEIDNNYKNVIKIPFSSSESFNIDNDDRDLSKIDNIRVQFFNGYEMDFNRSNNDYVNGQGKATIYPSADESKMCLYDVDKVVDFIASILDNCPRVKTVEIAVMNNFGYEKDKNGKKLIDEINKKLRRTLYARNIKVFIQAVDERSYIDKVTNQYASGEKQTSVAANLIKYYSIDNENGNLISYRSQEEYEDELRNEGFYNNLSDVSNEEEEESEQKAKDSLKLRDKVGIILWDVDFDRDEVAEMRKAEEKEIKDKIKNIKDKNKQLKQQKVVPINSGVQKERYKLTPQGQVLCCLAGLIFFVAGYFILASLLKQSAVFRKVKDEEVYNNKRKPISNNRILKSICAVEGIKDFF